jgi:dTDP-4-dehydrorhamnose reductase
MKILVTGSNGLLGQKLTELIQSKPGDELIATARGKSAVVVGRGTFHQMDICDPAEVSEVLTRTKPEVVIHGAAMTLVDKCELEKEACWKSNVEAVENIIKGCAKVGARLVQVSTDFIFDGSEGPLTEEAVPSPINYYGESKLAAEKIIMASNLHWSILRTVLVYGLSNDQSRSNIVLWVKESLEKGKTIQVVNDQWRTPTLAEDLAIGCYLAATKKASGIYNISGKDFITPYDIAIHTAEFFDLDKSLIKPADSTTFKQPARRPLRTGLVIDKARAELGYEPRSFGEGIELLARQMQKVPA